MTTSFTFFRKSVFSKGAIIYGGEVKSESAAAKQAIAPVYDIDFDGHDFALRYITQSLTSGMTVLLGQTDGMAKRSARIEGFNSGTTAKRTGWFFSGWTFVDFMGNKFTWIDSWWTTSWTLYDAGGKKIATFSRSMFVIIRCGTLVIHEPVPDSLMALILLTCKMVHNTLKRHERISVFA
ncbi:hypothetical protein LPJ66_004343 [Kickxella alabastrina]|uniref:Uncharacterized protein n=1 Tax=Kickxella alabastrina TaxID=61397 RepID=A0ACC1IJV9_9FUNG|nr:hypothetical protein LPJ66_004343 [Kickxella alabastrina]